MNFIIKKKARNIFFMFLIIIVLLMSCNLSLAGKESTVIINTGLVKGDRLREIDHLRLKVQASNETVIDEDFLIQNTLNISVPSNAFVKITLYGMDKKNVIIYSGSCQFTLAGEKKYEVEIKMVEQQ